MFTSDLPQDEADNLLKMEKHVVGDATHNFPEHNGGRMEVKLENKEHKEDFILDVSRGRIDLRKITYQNRARKVVILARLDLVGPPHQNPDGQVIGCPHIHYYREGYGDKWAADLPTDIFTNIDDIHMTLEQFMQHCSIITKPFIPQSLFVNLQS